MWFAKGIAGALSGSLVKIGALPFQYFFLHVSGIGLGWDGVLLWDPGAAGRCQQRSVRALRRSQPVLKRERRAKGNR